jgi:hypothetical protein
VAPSSAARRSWIRSIGHPCGPRQLGEASPGVPRPGPRGADGDRVPRRDPAEAGETALFDLARDAPSDARIAEPPEHGWEAAFLDQEGKQVPERVCREGVRIGVAINPHAPRPRGVDLGEQLAGAPPVVHARELQVDDLHVDPGRLGRRDRLADGLEDSSGLVSHVGGVRSAVTPDHREEPVQLIRAGEGAGRGEEAGGQADGAGRQALVEQPSHRGPLVVGRRTVVQPDGHQAQRVVADLHDHVHRGGRKPVHVLGEARLPDLDPGGEAGQILLKQGGAPGQRRRDGEPAVTDHLGRHALAHLALGPRRIGQREVRVGLDVDESGRHDQAPGVDRAARGSGVGRGDRDDLPVAYRDVRAHGGRPGTVQHLTAADDEIVHVERPDSSPSSAPGVLVR